MFAIIEKMFMVLLTSKFNTSKFSVRSCNTLNDLSNKVCVPSKTEDLNVHVFIMITGNNESKILTKNRSCKCKCKFDGKKCHSNKK